MIKPNFTKDQCDAALAAVTGEYHVTKGDIFSRDKRTSVSEARMWFWLILRIASEASMPALGRLSGHQHSSVSHSLDNAISWMRLYPALRRRYDRIIGLYNKFTPGPTHLAGHEPDGNVPGRKD